MQMQKYDLSVASAKYVGIGSGKYIYLTFSSEALGEVSNNSKIGSWNLCVSFVLPWAGNVEYYVGPQVEMRQEAWAENREWRNVEGDNDLT